MFSYVDESIHRGRKVLAKNAGKPGQLLDDLLAFKPIWCALWWIPSDVQRDGKFYFMQ